MNADQSPLSLPPSNQEQQQENHSSKSCTPARKNKSKHYKKRPLFDSPVENWPGSNFVYPLDKLSDQLRKKLDLISSFYRLKLPIRAVNLASFSI